uniref:(northern house mosquito) hypothetical protein n=1 Tax=Culex pipiens TaxID=7175 RepID=A0A8D8FPQ5_CULPI
MMLGNMYFLSRGKLVCFCVETDNFRDTLILRTRLVNATKRRQRFSIERRVPKIVCLQPENVKFEGRLDPSTNQGFWRESQAKDFGESGRISQEGTKHGTRET